MDYYYLAIKSDKVLVHTAWMNLENIFLSERVKDTSHKTPQISYDHIIFNVQNGHMYQDIK